MEKVTDWAALWRQLAETRYWRGFNRPEARQAADAWRNKAREFDERIKRRWMQPDSSRSFVLSQVHADTTVLDIGAGTGRWAMLLAPHVRKPAGGNRAGSRHGRADGREPGQGKDRERADYRRCLARGARGAARYLVVRTRHVFQPRSARLCARHGSSHQAYLLPPPPGPARGSSGWPHFADCHLRASGASRTPAPTWSLLITCSWRWAFWRTYCWRILDCGKQRPMPAWRRLWPTSSAALG